MTRGKPVDVEDLVAWAAGELARKRPGKVVALPVFNVSRGDRELVGRWDWPMGFPRMSPMFAAGLGSSCARGEPPHPDALIVEDAIGEVAAAGNRQSAVGKMGSDLASTADCRLPTADLLFGLGFTNLDAQGALDAALANVSNLLLVHGRLRSRPLVRLEASPVRAKLAENGKPGIWRREEWAEPTWDDHAPECSRVVEVAIKAKRRNSYPAGAYCRLEYDPDPQMVVNERAEYFVWRAGLAALAERLHGKMGSHIALAPRAALRPWLGDCDGDAVRDLFAAGAEGVYSGGEARALQGERASGRRRPVCGGAAYSRRPVKPIKGLEEA